VEAGGEKYMYLLSNSGTGAFQRSEVVVRGSWVAHCLRIGQVGPGYNKKVTVAWWLVCPAEALLLLSLVSIIFQSCPS
jgi:hypothetical protein